MIFHNASAINVDQLSQGKLPQSRDDEDTLDSKLLMKLDKLADLTVSAKAQTSLRQKFRKWCPMFPIS